MQEGFGRSEIPTGGLGKVEDYYQTLGVEKTATAEQIKKAYRNMAFKYHPDRNAGNAEAEEKFKKINEAYSVLGDEQKKREYDLYGAGSGSASGAYGNGYRNGGSAYRNGGSSYQSNGTYGSYGSYNWGNSGDPFWDFFNETRSSGRNTQWSQDRNTYTWTRKEASHLSRRQGVRMFGQGVLKAFVSLALFRVLFWVFPLNIICIVVGFSGVSSALRSLKYIFQGSNNK